MLDPVENPSLHHQPVYNKHHLKENKDDLTESVSNCLKCRLSIPLTFFFLWKTRLTQILVVSFKGIFVNNDRISKDAMNKFGSWSIISLQNEK